MKYRTIDLCAGIGGIRKGFEMTGGFQNVLSAEIDNYACMAYQNLYGENPKNDLTSDQFKYICSETEYDVLLAGFPCQTFSRAGKQEGFANATKGTIFFHIVDIIKQSRHKPKVIFLENVDHLTTHDNGNTFKTILNVLVKELNYRIVGVHTDSEGNLLYNTKDFIRNSKDFGIPQNRPRVYIIGFDADTFSEKDMKTALPKNRMTKIYQNLNDLLDKNVSGKFFMSAGYLETLEKHAVRQREHGNGFGYKIINLPDNPQPLANTILATGGSGKERNLIYDPLNGKKYAGKVIGSKQTPVNDKFIRVMTPNEWGKLQGFINYAFKQSDGTDMFSFPKEVSDTQQYKLFGNSVTIPVIEQMAYFVLQQLNDKFQSKEEIKCA